MNYLIHSKYEHVFRKFSTSIVVEIQNSRTQRVPSPKDIVVQFCIVRQLFACHFYHENRQIQAWKYLVKFTKKSLPK